MAVYTLTIEVVTKSYFLHKLLLSQLRVCLSVRKIPRIPENYRRLPVDSEEVQMVPKNADGSRRHIGLFLNPQTALTGQFCVKTKTNF